MRTTAGSVAALLTLLEPLVAAVLARVLLDEPMTPVMTAGAALLLVAVATASLRPAG
jgi:DME family drug/metabolite transporter